MQLRRTFWVRSPLQIVIAVTVISMFLNVSLPLNFLSVEAEATEYPFRLTMSLEKTAYKLGELVYVTSTLTNIGEENVTLQTGGLDRMDFFVYDENFIRVFQDSRRHFGTVLVLNRSFLFPPGDSITGKGFWDQTRDGSGEVIPELWREEALPGIYYIVGVFSSRTYNIEPKTPAIRITIA